jgi:WD40-like Beta Propeller Repeat
MTASCPTRSRLTFEKLIAQNPVWAADNEHIVFTSNRLGSPKLFSVPATGVGEAELLLPSDQSDTPRACSPDGRYLILTRTPLDKMLDHTLWVLPLFGEKRPCSRRPIHSNGGNFFPRRKVGGLPVK